MEKQTSVEQDESRSESTSSNNHSRRYYRATQHRIFVNRSLHLQKIKFFGFDMDHTLAEYISPDYEELQFNLIIDRLISIGYPSDIKNFQYEPAFPIRGLWFDQHYGTLLKVDAYGNIMIVWHGFTYYKTHEIYRLYPNKFVQPDDSRISILSTLYNLPEAYLLACLIQYFVNTGTFRLGDTGVRTGDMFMSFKSLYRDCRDAIDWVHTRGSLKEETLNNLDKYVKKDEQLPLLFDRLRETGKVTFLLTNSDYAYTDKIMTYLFNFPTSGKIKNWKEYFDYILVDARKPIFFTGGTILRQVDTETGILKLGHHVGPLTPGHVYSGGDCDEFSAVIGADNGKDVLYIGDHIYGDILKSKKTRGWRTFLIIPELHREVHVWTSKCRLFNKLQEVEILLGDVYREMDSSCKEAPDIRHIKKRQRELTHLLDMSYGLLGSTFRSGSRPTFFANQIMHYADLYARSVLNLVYYPFCYMFQAPPLLMPHESTVEHEKVFSNGETEEPEEDEDILLERLRRHSQTMNQESVPSLYAIMPSEVTHHHDTDDDEEEYYDEEQSDKSAEN